MRRTLASPNLAIFLEKPGGDARRGIVGIDEHGESAQSGFRSAMSGSLCLAKEAGNPSCQDRARR